ncbi:MAG: ferritin-like domain-containing protein [Thalassobaculales bacterium]
MAARAVAVLTAADPLEKVRLTAAAAADWRAGRLAWGGAELGGVRPPDRPARPARPLLVPPGQVKRRRIGAGPAGRLALLHALAHIELNAIDLAWDMLARFPGSAAFCADWVGVAAEEAVHFTLLAERLAALGGAYGDLPAHDGLWQAAEATAHDLLARLAVVPLVLEARGLDVTPAMILRLAEAGDHASAAVLTRIHDDEIGHVAVGRRWFDAECRARGLSPEAAFHDLVRRHFRGRLKPPFNAASRAAAGLPAGFYEPLVSA